VLSNLRPSLSRFIARRNTSNHSDLTDSAENCGGVEHANVPTEPRGAFAFFGSHTGLQIFVSTPSNKLFTTAYFFKLVYSHSRSLILFQVICLD
jgi:hypothetical protein